VKDVVRTLRLPHQTTILVVDDSPAFRQVLRDALIAAGHFVLEAATGEEGLALAGACRPDAIVVDGIAPSIGGNTVIRRLRLDAALRQVPCLLLTSEGTNAELRALDAGADAFVRREEHVDIIVGRLSELLLRSSPRQHAGDPLEGAVGLRKILAVDDDVDYLRFVGEALKWDGFDVILARSGQEALDVLATQPVDCILLDRQMPGLSGQETCERIKAVPVVRDIPLIMLTASEDREAMIKGLSAGADDYISKSSQLEVLKARMHAQIRRKQFEDENRRIREELLRKELEAAEARAARELAETKAVLVDELERKNKELEAFSYSVSHDLRAPLRAIDGFSRFVLDDFGSTLDPKAQEYLQRVCAAAQRMGTLIDDLLELSRVGRAELRRTRVNLSTTARHAIAELRRESDRQIEIVIQDDLWVEADSRLMQIALDNLLGNSWKFTAGVAHPRIEFGCDLDGSSPTYFVRDNGAGFDSRYAEKLFRPFQRLHNEREFPGTGIGLATVYRILDRHGGRVWAVGAIGEGATFYFTVPAAGQAVSI
jgi:two-component system NtrC family sensor kinase